MGLLPPGASTAEAELAEAWASSSQLLVWPWQEARQQGFYGEFFLPEKGDWLLLTPSLPLPPPTP